MKASKVSLCIACSRQTSIEIMEFHRSHKTSIISVFEDDMTWRNTFKKLI